MNKFAPLAFVATLSIFSLAPAALHAETSQSVRAASQAAAPVNVLAGRTLFGGNGNRIAAVYRVDSQGRVQVILDGKLITVPGSTLSEVNGKFTTSMTKQELLRSAR
jgi:hypothetical protein